MIPISEVVNVQLNVTPAAEPQRDVGTIAVLSEDWTQKVLTGEKYMEFSSQEAIEKLFGAASETANITSLVFQQSPRPNKLVISGYNKAAATSAEAGYTEAINALSLVYPGWYAVVFTSNIPKAKLKQVVDTVTAQNKIAATGTTAKDDLSFNDTNEYKQIYLASQDRVLVSYHTTNKYAYMAALATMLSVNWNGSKTKKTLMWKVAAGLVSDNLELTDLNKAKALGINCYTLFGSSPMWAHGRMLGKRYFDEVHGLDWFVDAVQKNVFNALYQNPTQVDLTDAGIQLLVARVKEAARNGVRNGLFAPGNWRIDGFGALKRGDFLEDGFYVWADGVATLTDTQVENREAPVIYAAVKLAGAVHKSDVIIGFSR